MINRNLGIIDQVEAPTRDYHRWSPHPRCQHDGCTTEVRFRSTGGYCLKHYHHHREEIEMPPRQYTDDQIRTAMAAPGSIIQKAATIGAHHSALAYRARKLGLLAPPTPRPGNGKATARKAKTGLDRAWEDASKNLRKNAEIMAGAPETKAPEGRCQGVVSAADIDAQSPLSPLQEELHRMGNIVHNFRGLSAAGRTWVLSRLTADQAA